MANKQPAENAQCATCMHYDEEYPGICPAFPNGIPDGILSGKDTHEQVHPKQVADFVYYMHPNLRYPSDSDIITGES